MPRKNLFRPVHSLCIPIVAGLLLTSPLRSAMAQTTPKLKIDSRTDKVRVDLNVAGIPDKTEDTQGGFIPINDDFDEGNRDAAPAPDKEGARKADNEDDAIEGDRIKIGDNELRSTTLTLAANTASAANKRTQATTHVKGTWKLTFPASIKVWKQIISTTTPPITSWQRVPSGQASDEVTLDEPLSVPLQVEGVSTSSGALMSDAIDAVFTLSDGTLGGKDKVVYSVVKVNLTTNGFVIGSDGFINDTSLTGVVSELDEEDIGAYLHYNVDDDDQSDVKDVINDDVDNGNDADNDGDTKKVIPPDPDGYTGYDYKENGSVSGENDLMPATISLLGFGGIPKTGKVILTSSGVIQVWKNAEKGTANAILIGANHSKTWDLGDTTQRSEFQSAANSLYIEGIEANSSGTLTVEYQYPVARIPLLPVFISAGSDIVKENSIASTAGIQPRTWPRFTQIVDHDGETVIGAINQIVQDANGVPEPGPFDRQRDRWENKQAGFTGFSNMKDCEFSITENLVTWKYNCIAYSVGEYGWWYSETQEDLNNNTSSVDKDFGNNDNKLDVSEMDNFYSQKKNYHPTATGPGDATVMYFSGYHAALHTPDSHSGMNKWIMYQSKCGSWERIEHIWDQLNGGSYGSPIRFYK